MHEASPKPYPIAGPLQAGSVVGLFFALMLIARFHDAHNTFMKAATILLLVAVVSSARVWLAGDKLRGRWGAILAVIFYAFIWETPVIL